MTELVAALYAAVKATRLARDRLLLAAPWGSRPFDSCRRSRRSPAYIAVLKSSVKPCSMALPTGLPFLFFFWNISTCSPVIVGGWAWLAGVHGDGRRSIRRGAVQSAVAWIEPPCEVAYEREPGERRDAVLGLHRDGLAAWSGSVIVTLPSKDVSTLP